ncbi:unnamed protein product, partial [Aphanomyces euteiches]
MVLGIFSLLATSSHYDLKANDSTTVVALPAWRQDNLLTYARHTNRVTDAGLAREPSLCKLVKEQYFFSGGSLGQFCKKRQELVDTVDICCNMRDHEQENCMFNLYVADPDKLSHYSTRSQWRLCIDSGYALTKLAKQVCTDNISQEYQFGTSIDAGFDRTAYKLYFHHRIYESLVKKKPVVIYMRDTRQSTIELRSFRGKYSDMVEMNLTATTIWKHLCRKTRTGEQT